MLTSEELYKLLMDEEECGISLHVLRAEVAFGDLNLYFNINRDPDFTNPESDENWMLEARAYKDSRIAFGPAAGCIIEGEHPLLWKFTDINSELYYSGQCPTPANLVADLYKLELELFENFQTFGHYLNGGDIFRLLSVPSGLFARGPQKLLAKYAKLLADYGINTSIISGNASNADTSRDEGHPKVFLLTNHCYVIAEEFKLTRQ
jgi:hypothetical protein